MIYLGFFSEMNCYEDNGSINDFLTDEINYDKAAVIKYLKSQKRIAGCPREAIDCISKEVISPSFSIYSDGEYEWCDFLIYHIEKYNIFLPQSFIKKAISA